MPDVLKIAITGPESTGKSMLAQQLADHYVSVWVPEYARVHLLKIDRPYNYDDILEIAQKQQQSERVIETLANGIVFSDTELLVTKIWCEVKYQKCHPWILDELTKQHYDLYLLMDCDLPWEYDPLREHPDQRRQLYDLYKNELEKQGFNYKVVSGKDELRFNNALGFVKEIFRDNSSTDSKIPNSEFENYSSSTSKSLNC